ncbi:MAG: hypothetical protein K5882_09685 [Bacteroidales bacterium]|nr:hypothetical protein [Bacteroidales bacterium]
MRKIYVLLAIFATFILALACNSNQPSKEQLVGTWVHPIQAGTVSINDSKEVTPVYNNEIFTFSEDGTFVFGEYGDSLLYEVTGIWEVSTDKKNIVFSYEDGETSSIDIREFDGTSFITTSREGNDFKFTKK